MYLYAGSCLLFAQTADQSPSVAGNVRHVGDWLHLLWIPDAHLQDMFNTQRDTLFTCENRWFRFAAKYWIRNKNKNSGYSNKMKQSQTTESNSKPTGRLMFTSGIHKAQLTWTHLVPLRVGFMAPPFLGQSWHFGRIPSAQIRHNQLPFGTFWMP